MTWQPIDTAPKDGVSLAHARLRALQILADTEVRIQLERQKEFASLFADAAELEGR